MNITNLKTLHQTNPLGIDQIPYFSWVMESKKNNTMQTSYRIIVTENGYTVWDTGFVKSEEQSFIEYQGEPLKSCQEYLWQVIVYDNQGNESKAEASFETAFLSKTDWKAMWVESSIPREKSEQWGYGLQPPAVLFFRDFNIKSKVSKARLYATSYGIYQAYMNEVRPDDREFAPEHTVYRSILYYQTYDVTKLIKIGQNRFSMYVGDGWYLCPQTGPITDDFHDTPSILFQLEIEYEDGSRETLASDGSELCCTGSIRFSDIFMGEKQDANATFDEGQPVRIEAYGVDHLFAQPMPPVRPIKLLPAEKVYISQLGETIVDFGQIICGRARIHIEAPRGSEIVLEYFEVPDKDGNYYNSMLAPQKDIYVSDGSSCEYEAKFTFHGFRYIRVTGMVKVRIEDFTAVVLTTQKENAGTFTCSDERLNRLYQNVRWSQVNNMMSIPTDCPTREKAGFTGDIQIYARTALMNEDVTPFLSSWMKNLAADQMEDGVVPMTVPFTRLYERLSNRVKEDFGDTKITGIAGWSDAAVIVPYIMYQVTGNKLVLREYYDTMMRWCDYVIRTANDKRGDNELSEEIDRYLWNTGFHFGEWLIPSQPEADGNFGICRISSRYIAPFFGYYSLFLFGEIAHLLGKADSAYYRDKAAAMKLAIQKGVMKDGKMPAELMGAYVLAFAFDLVPEEYYESFKDKLVAMLEQNHYRLDTGFLATPYLLDALVKIGRQDLANKLLWQDKQPSWLYEVDLGATAIWEHWGAMSPDRQPIRTSYDHYAFGCVDDWICRNIAGIDCDKPGFKHILINPRPDEKLTWCKRTYQSEYGEISVYWTKEQLKVTIPANTTALIIWQGIEYEVGSGKYVFDFNGSLRTEDLVL